MYVVPHNWFGHVTVIWSGGVYACWTWMAPTCPLPPSPPTCVMYRLGHLSSYQTSSLAFVRICNVQMHLTSWILWHCICAHPRLSWCVWWCIRIGCSACGVGGVKVLIELHTNISSQPNNVKGWIPSVVCLAITIVLAMWMESQWALKIEREIVLVKKIHAYMSTLHTNWQTHVSGFETGPGTWPTFLSLCVVVDEMCVCCPVLCFYCKGHHTHFRWRCHCRPSPSEDLQYFHTWVHADYGRLFCEQQNSLCVGVAVVPLGEGQLAQSLMSQMQYRGILQYFLCEWRLSSYGQLWRGKICQF